MVATGVDTLELHTVAPLRPVMVRQLEVLKAQAAATPPGQPLPTWQAAGLVFEVRRGGSKRGAFLLDSEAMALSLNPNAPDGLPTGMAEIRSRHLWQDVDKAAEDAEEALSVLTVGEHPDVQVSRVDVTADWQGWEPERDLLDRFVCRARSDASYRKHRKHTGWAWGSGGATYARCYDKTAEIRNTEKAQWFPEIWAQHPGYVADETVWRLEFQVRREAIRELTPLGVQPGMLKSWSGTREYLGSIFSTMSDGWLSLRLPRTGKSRQRMDPRWEKLRELARWAGCEAPVDLARVQAETEFERTTAQLAAYLARGVAELWALHGEREVTDSIDRLYIEAAKHFTRRGESIEARAKELYEPLRVKAAAKKAREQQRRRDAAESAQRAMLH